MAKREVLRKEVKKDFDYIWDIIEVPVMIMVIYSILELFFSVNSYIAKVIPANIFSILLTIFLFGWIGYNAIKQGDTPKEASKYGAYAGIITGFVGAIIGLITFYFYPEKIAETLAAAAQTGADMQMVQTFMKIGIYANFVLSPAINAGIGALIAWLGALVFNKNKRK